MASASACRRRGQPPRPSPPPRRAPPPPGHPGCWPPPQAPHRPQRSRDAPRRRGPPARWPTPGQGEVRASWSPGLVRGSTSLEIEDARVGPVVAGLEHAQRHAVEVIVPSEASG
eukprot:scaffold38574_cov49-Phaeocystis_antarctica.AAC.2